MTKEQQAISKTINELRTQEALHEANRKRCYSIRKELERLYAPTPRKGMDMEKRQAIRDKIIAGRMKTMLKK